MSRKTKEEQVEVVNELPPELLIYLDPPISFGGKEADVIALREPKVCEVLQADKHLKSAVTTEAIRNYQVALIAAVSGLQRQHIEQLPIRKLNEAAKYLQGFLDAGQETSES